MRPSRHWRRTNPGTISALSTVLVLTVLWMSPMHAQGKQISGTLSIEEGGYYGWQLDVVIPSQIEVEITGKDGALVDLLVLDKANYSRYEDGLTFKFYDQYSALRTSNATLNFTVLKGTVYLVVDNSNRPSGAGGASPTGAVTIDYWLGSSFDFHAVPQQDDLWLVYLLVGVAGFTLVLVVVLARMAIKGRKGGPTRNIGASDKQGLSTTSSTAREPANGQHEKH